jgi:hypothetical protein
MVPIEKITRFFLNDFANTQKGQRQWTKDKTKDEQKVNPGPQNLNPQLVPVDQA